VRFLAVALVFLHLIQMKSFAQQVSQGFAMNNSANYLWPEENEVVFNRNIDLKWQGNLQAAPYHLQIATDKYFEQTILDTFIDKPYCTIIKLERHKNYFWRIVGDTSINDPEFKNIDYSFFKTTAILMDESRSNTDVSLIPSWVNNQELLYIDNPENLEYDVTVISVAENSKKFFRKTNSVKQGIMTQNWPRGRYIVELKIGEMANQVTEFVLTQN
jgi:hypothetical protein